jgi:hypothetical protein
MSLNTTDYEGFWELSADQATADRNGSRSGAAHARVRGRNAADRCRAQLNEPRIAWQSTIWIRGALRLSQTPTPKAMSHTTDTRRSGRFNR